MEDVWFLGDWFLKDVFPTLQAIRHGSTVQRRPPPYLYDMFNVFYFFTSPLTFGNNTLLRINNAFIEALNRREHLLKYIIVMLDQDLIDMINRFDFGITIQLERAIRWLSTQFERQLNAQKEQLWTMKPGAIPKSDTKIIWVEMFDHPVRDPAVNICNKFNRGLNEMA